MKKIISILLCLTFAIMPLCSISVFADEENYTQIKSESDFLNMDPNGAYQLANDITISQSYSKEFCGILDGNGKKLRIADNASTPIFTTLKGASIKNIWTIGHVKVSNPNSHAGGIANSGSATFENVTNQISVTASGEGYSSFAKSLGGFIGHINDTSSFINCTNTGAVTLATTTLSTPEKYFITEGVGGFVGSIDAPEKLITFKGCLGSNFISSLQPGVNVGGFVGFAQSTSFDISDCENESDVSGKAFYDTNNVSHHHSGVGGIFGALDSKNNTNAKLIATNTKNSGNVTGYEIITMVGGFAGMTRRYNDMTFVGCSNSGTLINDKNVWEGIGGIIGFLSDTENLKVSLTACSNLGYLRGYLTAGLVAFLRECPKASITFKNCFNTGSTEATRQYTGGIAGFIESKESNLYISKCVNTGTIKAIPEGWGAGGILGSGEYLSSATIENCVNTGNIISGNGVFHAAGISSSFYGSSNIYIKNCVNAGTLNHTYASGNIMHIVFSNNAVTAPVFVANTYLNGVSGSGENATSANIASIRGTVDSILTTAIVSEDYVSIEKLNEARVKLSSADSASSIGASAIELICEINALQTIEEYLADDKAELIEALGSKLDNADEAYTAESFEAYSKAFDDILTSINNAKSENELKAISVETLLAEDKALLVPVEKTDSSDNDNNDDTQSDATEIISTESNATENITSTDNATAEQTEPIKIKGGCGSVIASSSILAITALTLGAVIIKKKKFN